MGLPSYQEMENSRPVLKQEPCLIFLLFQVPNISLALRGDSINVELIKEWKDVQF